MRRRRRNPSDLTLPLVGVVVTGAAFAGLLALGASRHREKTSPATVPLGGGGVSTVGPFPSLRVGDLLLVDAASAQLPEPLRSAGRVAMQVDMVLSDPLLVSASNIDPRFPSTRFSGTIPKAAIVSALSPPISSVPFPLPTPSIPFPPLVT